MTKKIYLTQPILLGNEIKYAKDCIKSTWLTTGPYVDNFEKKFAKYCSVNYASTTSSGTTALHLALLAFGIQKGDEVIVPDLSYVSTANVVKYVGAKPVFIDVSPYDYNIDVSRIEEKISKKTKAIIPVHLYGFPADMDPINRIAKKHKLIVIEDACQSLGALYKGKKIGSMSDIGCFSFSGAKIVTTGEGGMMTSNNKKLINIIQDIKSNYTDKKRHFYHSSVGYPFRLTNLQAALGLAQLERINDFITIKIKNAQIYKQLLKKNELIQLPPENPDIKNVFWLYSIVLKKPGLRDNLMKYLFSSRIQTRPFFAPLHALPMYKDSGIYKNSDYLSENGISLPSGLNLKINDIEYICKKVNYFIKKND